jgi:hypothetical protein
VVAHRTALLVAVLGSACIRDGADPPPPPRYQLTVTSELGGVVTSEPAGISCGQVCEGRFRRGTVVTLRAEVDPGVEFAGWGGVCQGTGLCTVSVHGDLALSARFVVAGTDRKVPESMRRPSDLDRDGVPDDRDECPVEPAAAGDADGCPEETE